MNNINKYFNQVLKWQNDEKLIEIIQLKTKDTFSYSMKHEMQSNKTRQSLKT